MRGWSFFYITDKLYCLLMNNEPTTFIGIDPGLSGGIAILDTETNDVQLYDMPVLTDGKKRHIDIQAVLRILRSVDNKSTFVGIENVNAMPGQGVTSMFTMGFGLGLLHACVSSCNYPFTRVQPQTWKKDYSLLKKDKQASIMKAKELFPEADITLKRHDGRAEALLIADYTRRNMHC